MKMKMKTIKVSEATGPALDWLVAKCEGYSNLRFHREPPLEGGWIVDPPRVEYGPMLLADVSFSTDWSQGGPIIEREGICLRTWYPNWDAYKSSGPTASRRINGPTALIAAMRCYAASKLGETVEAPDELAQENLL